MKYRIEHDSMGQVEVPADRCWGAQTQRSLQNFAIGQEKMPRELIEAFAHLKAAAAKANAQLGCLAPEKARAIVAVCYEILQGKYKDQFPLSVWQTGSGTQTNMNVNEVIAYCANAKDDKAVFHPNDDINRSQSSNDTFPTAMHIAAVLAIEQQLLPSLDGLIDTFETLSVQYDDVLKCGRTHLQDAVPLTFGQEVGGWRAMLRHNREQIESVLPGLRALAIGGTAVGTGLNAPVDFDKIVAKELTRQCKTKFVAADNKYAALSAKDEFVFAHGALCALSGNLFKIASDVRLMASGPRCGLGEIHIPQNEPGSSIMPGKVNPTQCEAVTMVAAQVMGNDTTISFAASQGHFQLNVFLPVIAYDFLQSVRLLSDCIRSFDTHCAQGIAPDREKMLANVHNSLMLVTALSPRIGYEAAAKVAQKAYSDNSSLKEACLALGYLSAEEFDEVFCPEQMTKPLA